MLQEAKDLQLNAVTELVEQLRDKDEITFKAPTGSGKTYMMADLMNRVLENNDDIVFLVSSLSKGDLAGQNYSKFCEYKQTGAFPNLNPYLISTELSGEERLYIPTDYNVYILPRDLYKKGGRLMQGAMDAFLQEITGWYSGDDRKEVFLIKDECHIATNNLDTLSDTYFAKVLNFSATPNLRRGQHPDVEIKSTDAENAKLIKHIVEGEENDTVGDAINKFEEVKENYRNLLGVNPCLIIQISNGEQGTYELNNLIFPELSKAEHQDLKWMLIVDKDADCDTNDVFKAKKLPVSRWKDYAKENTSGIDIIIFKMVISEGWDIPRACMLYQVRDVHSPTLGEQVIGRVRRNPRLLDYERLSLQAQELAMTAWIWANINDNVRKTFGVRLWDEPEDITNAIKIHTTRLKPLTEKRGFDLEAFLSSQPNISSYSSIFELYKAMQKLDNATMDLCYDYVGESIEKWWKIAEHAEKIAAESNRYSCDYAESMELTTDDSGATREVSFPVTSSYVDNGNYVNIGDWVWKRRDGKDKFSFDSEAEREWASIIKELVSSDTDGFDGKRVGKRVLTGKRNPNYGQINVFGDTEPERINAAQKYLWGKNYLLNSEIKFEYCLGGVHSSYPDFIMKDSFDRIHLFEVKSVNISNATPAAFDSTAYKVKVEELKKCYKQASLLTGYLFYLPVYKGDEWHITQLANGNEKNMTLDQFKRFMRTSIQ